jgi:hypothetical protein
VPELSRRARGFGTWAMLRQFGRAGIAELVERGCPIAAAWRPPSPRAGRRAGRPVVLNQFMVRFGDDDAATLATVERVQADAIAFIGAATWRGRWVMRVSVSSAATIVPDWDGEVTVAAVTRGQVIARLARRKQSSQFLSSRKPRRGCPGPRGCVNAVPAAPGSRLYASLRPG